MIYRWMVHFAAMNTLCRILLFCAQVVAGETVASLTNDKNIAAAHVELTKKN